MSKEKKKARRLFFPIVGSPIIAAALVCGAWDPGYFNEDPEVANLLPEADARFRPSIAECLASLNEPVRESVKYIAVTDDPWHYRTPCGGHCHENGLICLKSNTAQWRPQIVWHEAFHAWHFRVADHLPGWNARWRAIAGGELTEYARESRVKRGCIMEDVAEWGREIHFTLAGRWSAFDDPGFFKGDLSAERQKFALLCEAEAFSADQIKTVLEKYPALAIPTLR